MLEEAEGHQIAERQFEMAFVDIGERCDADDGRRAGRQSMGVARKGLGPGREFRWRGLRQRQLTTGADQEQMLKVGGFGLSFKVWASARRRQPVPRRVALRRIP